MTEANTIDADKVRRFVAEIERCDEELLSERGSYMLRCKNIRERKSDWKTQANEAGIPRKALSIELKRRELERKLDAVTEDVEEDIVDLADQIREALGGMSDLPLGQAAVEAAEAKDGKKAAKKNGRAKKGADGEAAANGGDALSSLVNGDADVRPRHLREAEDARVKENVANLSGLKALN